MRYLFTVSLIVVFRIFTAQAQPYQLELSAAANQKVFIGINGNLVDTLPNHTFRIDSLKQPRIVLWVLSDSLRSKQQFDITFFSPQRKSFKIDTTATGFSLLPISEGLYVTTTKPKEKRLITVPSKFTTLSLDSMLTQVDLNNYEGQTGCTSIISDSQFKELLIEAKSNIFESDKVKYLQEVVSSKCLKTHQMEQFLKLISYEDERLDFLLKNKGRIFNLKDVSELSSVFVIQSSKETFLQALE